jgi:hypothetical protein
MAKRMTLVVALMLVGAGGVCRGEGALTDTIGNPASAACKNPPATRFARIRNANRLRELIMTSEDLRKIELDWELIWYVSQPSRICHERVRGTPK